MHTDVATTVLASPAVEMPANNGKRCSDWRLWCRLCAKDDVQGNISVFFKDEQQNAAGKEPVVCSISATSDMSLATAIGKYFWVEIKRDEELPKMLCTECFSLVTSLVNFSERVAKVQQMFCVLHNTTSGTTTDLHAIRLKYGLLDEDREHVLMQQQLPEVHYLESKPKVNDLVEKMFENETTTTNPLEPPRIKINIKKENILEEPSDDDDLEECEGENLLNDIFDENENEEESYKAEQDEDDEEDSDNEEDQKQNLLTNQEDEIQEPPKKCQRRRRKRKKSNRDDGDCDDNEEDLDGEESDKLRENDGDGLIYTCTECPRKFKRVQHFRQHMKRTHLKTTPLPALPCGQCAKVFSTPRQLESHSKVHLPPELRKVVPCPYCEKKFSSHTLMQTHIKYIHMNERPFICEECGVAVRTNAALKTHMLTHTDYAPFECEICKKGFKNNIRLKNHMETHDPNKHVCAECGLQLNSRATLNRHLLVHSDEMQHKCDYCGRAFKRAKALKNHLILHTGLKPYSCDFCDRTFANGSNCRSHKKKAHPEELAALEAAGGAKTYTRNIPKLEALKAVTKAADNLAPVVSKQSGRFAFGKKPKLQPKEEVDEDGKQSNSPASASNNKHSTSTLASMEPASVPTTTSDLNVLHSALTPNPGLVAPNVHLSPATIPNIDNIYSHIMKQATIAAHNASVSDATNDDELTMHIKRSPSQASSCVTMENDGSSDMPKHHQVLKHLPLQQQQSSVMPAHFYTQIMKQNMHQEAHQMPVQHHMHQQQQQQQQMSHQQQQHLHAADDISSIRSPDSQASSHMTDDQANATASVQFYNHIRQNLQGPYM